MNTNLFSSIKQVKKFLEGSASLKFEGEHVREKYKWVEEVLVKFSYASLNKVERGVIRSYIRKISGYKSAQVTRLIRRYKKRGYVRCTDYNRNQFSKKYTGKDIDLLAKTDRLHDLNGAAIKKILERESERGDTRYKAISGISVSHLYNLRKDHRYQKSHTWFSKTKARAVSIGERKKPRPEGKPGFIRIDTVHQGDYEGQKGIYHINTVDEVTQWEIVGSIEKISEYYLRPLLEHILQDFPFMVLGFHSDNGSEFINKIVAKLLNKLLIQQTKSRARQTNDNALVESKNASVVRKHMGHIHIPQAYANQVNQFYSQYLNRYLNFHRPCFFSTETIGPKGKVRKKYRYEDMMTPYEKLKSLPNFQRYLRDDTSFEKLESIASEFSDNQFAERMVKARNKLWDSIMNRVA